MTDELAIEQGLPDTNKALPLLNDAFVDWGDEARLRWRYEESPRYEDEHTFCMTDDDELIALRRLFEKEIRGPSGQDYEFFVHGDTCVSPEHQGEGLYSKLYEETTAYCRQKDRDFSVTFNRVGNVTYEAKRKWGWQYRTLPVRLRVLSPEVVLPQYAQLALADDCFADTFLERFGHRIGLAVAGDRFRLQELVTDASMTGRALYLPVPEPMLTALIEAVTSEDRWRVLRRQVTPSRQSSPDSVTHSVHDPPFNAELIDTLYDLYETVTADYSLHFRRSHEDLRHMLAHPHLETLITVERGSKLVGAAPICLDTDGDVLEAQVLDIAAIDENAFDALQAAIEDVARDRKADAIVMITDYEPGPAWIRVDRQVMMWDSYGQDTTPLANESLRISLYDVT